MKVATRITVATAVVVAIASAAYAYFDRRAKAGERRAALEHEAHAVALTLRSNLEGQVSAFRAPSDTQLRELSRSTGGWKVEVLPRARAAQPPDADVSVTQLRRLNTLLEVPQLCGGSPNACAGIEGDTYFYALPLREATAAGGD